MKPKATGMWKNSFFHLFTTGSEPERTSQDASGRKDQNKRGYLSHAVQETLHFYDPLVSFCNLGFCGPDVALSLLQTPDVLIELSLWERTVKTSHGVTL